MASYAVIAQNDESKWDDVMGDLYHYPKRYQKFLSPGCQVIYYKGKMRNKAYLSSRLDPEPHYFGVARIGESIEDPESGKGDRYCEIHDFQMFTDPVPIKMEGEYLEQIPESRLTNYWRDGVRATSEEVFELITGLAQTTITARKLPSEHGELESFEVVVEGKKRYRYSSYYERSPINRERAISIHGTACQACSLNFERVYGEIGAGYIQVHHNKPLNESGETPINPTTDLNVLCANCHSMIHRKKSNTLDVIELKEILFEQEKSGEL